MRENICKFFWAPLGLLITLHPIMNNCESKYFDDKSIEVMFVLYVRMRFKLYDITSCN